MNNFNMIAKFAAETSQFAKGVNDMKQQLQGFEESTESTATKVGNAMASAGKVLTLGITAPLLTLGGIALKAGTDLETAMTGVAKTTDMGGKELENFKKELQSMSGEIPVATTELANIAESAGQLGIEKEHLLGFTRTMADLGVATNMSSEEAATSLARLANITQMPQTEFDKLGSVVVELGNNLATTESEIVEMSLRLAGTGKQVGLTEAEIMGLSGAMSSVGINAQAGGSAMSRVMQMINSDVLSGSENVENFAKVAGMSASEFSDTWQNEPVKALDAFVGGLGEVSESGGDVAGTLEELGINNINMIDTLSRLTGASGLMTDAVDMANNAWDENTALTNEAETAYDTVANKAIILGNKIKTLAQRVGDILLPIVGDVMDKFGEWIDKFSELDDSTLETIVKIAGFVAAVGPVLLVLGKLIAFIPVVIKGFAAFKSGMALTGLAALKTGSMMSVLGSAFAFLTSPIGIVVLAIGALIAIGVLLWKNWDEVSAKASEIWGAIKEYLSGVMESISTFFSEKWNSVKESTMNVWESISNFFTETIPMIVENIVEWFAMLPQRLREKWNEVLTNVTEWGSKMKEKGIEVGSEFLGNIIEFFSDLPYRIGFFIGESLGKVIVWSVKMWNKAKETGKNFYEGIKTFFSELPSRVWEWLLNAYNKATTWGSNMWTKAKETGQNFLNSITEFFSQLPGRIQEKLNDGYNRVSTWASQMWSKAKETGSNFVSGVIDYVSQLPSRVMTWLTDVISRATTWATNMGNKGRQAGQDLMNKTVSAVAGLPGKMVKAGADVVKGFWNGIKNLGGWIKGKVKGFFNGIVDGVKGALKISSPSKVFEEFGEFVDEGFVQGIDKGSRNVNRSMDKMVGGAIDIAKKADVIPVNFKTGMVGDVQRALDNSLNVNTPRISDQRVVHELSNYSDNKPMELRLVIGGRTFRAYVDSISEQQGKEIDLEMEF